MGSFKGVYKSIKATMRVIYGFTSGFRSLGFTDLGSVGYSGFKAKGPHPIALNLGFRV